MPGGTRDPGGDGYGYGRRDGAGRPGPSGRRPGDDGPGRHMRGGGRSRGGEPGRDPGRGPVREPERGRPPGGGRRGPGEGYGASPAYGAPAGGPPTESPAGGASVFDQPAVPGPGADRGPGASAPDRRDPGRQRYVGHGDDDGGGDEGDREPLLSRRGKPRRSRLQRALLAVGIVFVVMCLGGTSVAGYILVTYGSIDRVRDIEIAQAPPGEPRNFLLVGSDNREGTADEGSVSGRRSDTIIVARLDPESDRIGLLSFPRDLLVTRSDTNERDQINHAYSAENGEQVLIDTIALNFGIPIHHYVEIRFQAFQQLVDAIGGVELWVPNAVRDRHSGLFIEQLGCVTLDGSQGLIFARSRYVEYMGEDNEWHEDRFADVSRTQRQQIFIKRALSKALGQVQSNPLRLRELIDIGTSNVRLDDQLGVSEMFDLANDFRDFSADRLETYPLPVVDSPTQRGRLELDDEAAEPILNVFRGLDPGEVGPGVINVQVLNGTDRENLATDISAALQHIGFDLSTPGDTPERPAQTAVYHAPGQQNYGLRVARHITGGASVAERPDIAPGDVVVVAGADFSTIHDQPTPLDQMPTTTVAGQPADGPTTTPPTTAAETTTTTAPPPTTTTTASNGYIIGEPPPGRSCP